MHRLKLPYGQARAIWSRNAALKSEAVFSSAKEFSFRKSQLQLSRHRNFGTRGPSSQGKQNNSAGVRRPGAAWYAAIVAAGLGGGYYLWTSQGSSVYVLNETKSYTPCPKYQQVYNAIAGLLEPGECEDDYDDGSYGPVFVRLAWHSSGTYSKKDKSGGSNKATMRFEPESKFDANKGLHIARDRLEKIKQQFPWVSYGDLWTLAGVVAVQEMGGPTIPWRPGRVDGTAADCPPDGRLPDGAKGTPAHPREIFYRMGFIDQEIVALIGAHTLGRCHVERLGFQGKWSASPTTFSNSFYVDLLNRHWVERQWSGKRQFEDEETKELMMLPTDMTFIQDSKFKEWVKKYAKDEKLYFQHFALAYQKLQELGVTFPKGKQAHVFKTLEEDQASST